MKILKTNIRLAVGVGGIILGLLSTSFALASPVNYTISGNFGGCDAGTNCPGPLENLDFTLTFAVDAAAPTLAGTSLSDQYLQFDNTPLTLDVPGVFSDTRLGRVTFTRLLLPSPDIDRLIVNLIPFLAANDSIQFFFGPSPRGVLWNGNPSAPELNLVDIYTSETQAAFIVGATTNAAYNFHSAHIVSTAVPEPSTLVQLLAIGAFSGVAGLGRMAWRARRRT